MTERPRSVTKDKGGRILTAADLETGIANALEARDFGAVIDMLVVMAGIYPDRAEIVYETLKLGVEVGRKIRQSEDAYIPRKEGASNG